jgi:hypothetical protein
MIFHRTLFDYLPYNVNVTWLNLVDNDLSVSSSTLPDAYFLWNRSKLFYTPNAGRMITEIFINGCQTDPIETSKLSAQFEHVCINRTIDYVFIAEHEFYLVTDTRKNQ